MAWKVRVVEFHGWLTQGIRKLSNPEFSPFLWKSVPDARFALVGAHQWYVDVIGTIPRDSVDCDMGGT